MGKTVSSDRLIKNRKHFSESVMVSVAVSKTGKTKVHFIDKGTKVDGRYYRESCCRTGFCQTSSAVRRGVRFPAGWRSVAPGKVNGRVSAEHTQLYRAFCLAAEQSKHKPRRLCCLGCSAARCVQSSDRGFGGSQRQSVCACWTSLEKLSSSCQFCAEDI